MPGGDKQQMPLINVTQSRVDRIHRLFKTETAEIGFSGFLAGTGFSFYQLGKILCLSQ